MLLTKDEEKIIRKIAKIQINSFIRLSKFYREEIQKEISRLYEEGLDVEFTDYLEDFTREILDWELVYDSPARISFMNWVQLDMIISIIDSYLEQYPEQNPALKHVYLKVNLIASTLERQN